MNEIRLLAPLTDSILVEASVRWEKSPIMRINFVKCKLFMYSYNFFFLTFRKKQDNKNSNQGKYYFAINSTAQQYEGVL